jgi:hypothetical protein
MVLTYGFKGHMVRSGVVVVVVDALKQHFVLAVKVQKLSGYLNIFESLRACPKGVKNLKRGSYRTVAHAHERP